MKGEKKREVDEIKKKQMNIIYIGKGWEKSAKEENRNGREEDKKWNRKTS